MKVLITGFNPPPLQAGFKLEAANYRTWQFVQPLLNDGHEVCLCVEEHSPTPDANVVPPKLHWRSIPVHRPGWISRLQSIHDSFQPDCLVGSDFYSALWASRLKTACPLWVDLYGDPLTIMQVIRAQVGTDQGIVSTIAMLRLLLARGDVFSVCGTPQKHMLVGELAMCGRLNARTLGYDFVRIVPPGAPPPLFARTPRTELRAELGIPHDAFVVLWCGGYNAWTDTQTLFEGLALAMAGNPNIHHLSVGGSTYQAASTAFDQFVALVENSDFRSRFHLLGWQAWQEIPAYYQASDAGLSIDALHYETIYGTRTRLLEMLAHGLPVISSRGCELSYQLPLRDVGLNFESGDATALGQAIEDLSTNSETLLRMRLAAQALASADWSFDSTASALRDWVLAPSPSPDHLPGRTNRAPERFRYAFRALVRLLLWQIGLSGRRTTARRTRPRDQDRP